MPAAPLLPLPRHSLREKSPPVVRSGAVSTSRRSSCPLPGSLVDLERFPGEGPLSLSALSLRPSLKAARPRAVSSSAIPSSTSFVIFVLFIFLLGEIPCVCPPPTPHPLLGRLLLAAGTLGAFEAAGIPPTAASLTGSHKPRCLPLLCWELPPLFPLSNVDGCCIGVPPPPPMWHLEIH